MRVAPFLKPAPIKGVLEPTLAKFKFEFPRTAILSFRGQRPGTDRANAKVPNAEDVLKANPALQSLSPMAVFDETVRQLTDAGLMVPRG